MAEQPLQAVPIPGMPLDPDPNPLNPIPPAAAGPSDLNPVGQYQPGDEDYIADCDVQLSDCGYCARQLLTAVTAEIDGMLRLATAIAEQASATVLYKLDQKQWAAQAAVQVLTEDMHQHFENLYSQAMQSLGAVGVNLPQLAAQWQPAAGQGGAGGGLAAATAQATIVPGGGGSAVSPGPGAGATAFPGFQPPTQPAPPGGAATSPGGVSTFVPPQLGGISGPLVSSTSAGGSAVAQGGQGGSAAAVGGQAAGGGGGQGGAGGIAFNQAAGGQASAQAAGGSAQIAATINAIDPNTGTVVQVTLPAGLVPLQSSAPGAQAAGDTFDVPVDLDQPFAFKFAPDDAQWKQYALYFGGPWMQRYQAAPTLKAYRETRPEGATGDGIVSVELSALAPPEDLPPEPPNFQQFRE